MNIGQETLAALASPELVGYGKLCTERWCAWGGDNGLKTIFRTHVWVRDYGAMRTICTECPGRVDDSVLTDANAPKP